MILALLSAACFLTGGLLGMLIVALCAAAREVRE